MINTWVCFLVGLVLSQGSLSSPIPGTMNLEEDWTQFTDRLANPQFRLPTTTRPSRYQIALTPYFVDVPLDSNIDPFTFTGSVVIHITATEDNVNEIVMHCNNLTINSLSVTYVGANGYEVNITAEDQQFHCDPTLQFLRINTSVPLVQNREYTVRSSFVGRLQTNMRGFYRSWYRDGTELRWMATTQFQPGHAREAFPCYDEPGFKATFDISISRYESFSPTISNMPIKETFPPDTNGYVTDTFHTTPLMSTYLVAFIVSHYQEIASSNDVERPFKIYARNNTGNDTDGEWALDVGVRLLKAMEELTQIPYYNSTEYMDMKQAAIPDFSANAMENWGLLTYREALLLYNPAETNHFYKQRIANIVSHEVTHMWFGNLVTCAWWDNLWLNEGFARFYQYYLTARVEPDLGFETRFIVEQVHTAMFDDSVDTAHALTNPAVADPDSVSAHFSIITYAKGAAVLRMTYHLLGHDTYEKGLRSFLHQRSYKVSEPHHLFEAFDAAAEEDRVLAAYNGMTIDKYFRTWSEKAGHPLLTVKIDQATGRMSIEQSRWERTSGISNESNSVWHIPITWTRQNDVDFENLKPSQFVSDRTSTIERGTTGLEWVIFNKQESGFYRVNYDDTNWALLTRALRSDYERNLIHEYNRAQIVDDLFAFARAGVMPYQRAFNILSFLEFEDGYAPWIAAISGFEWIVRILAYDDTATAELNELIIEWSETVVARLGFSEPDGESYMPGLQRMYVNQFLCNVGHPECIAAARENFQAWITNGTPIPPNMRPWVYCTGLRYGTETDFDFFWNRYLNEEYASEQVVMVQAAGCTLDQNSLNKFWTAITQPENIHPPIVRGQDLNTAINSAINSNEENTIRSFIWVINNIDRTRDSPLGLETPLKSIIARLLNEQQIIEVNTWLTENQDVVGESVYNTSISTINTVRSNIQWYHQRAEEFFTFFDTKYVEQEVPEYTDAPDPFPSTNEPTDAPTDLQTDNPTDSPTNAPTDSLTDEPTDTPTDSPTDEPTDSRTDAPTASPTDAPTDSPTEAPTDSPTDTPTDSPTDAPTDSPTVEPTYPPTDAPTDSPTDVPTDPPTDEPTDSPTDAPTDSPTDAPTDSPTDVPTDSPTDEPTDSPTDAPTDPPTDAPTDPPTDAPTDSPTDVPTDSPTDEPTVPPTDAPTDSPTDEPTVPPTDAPTDSPTDVSTDSPTDAPTDPPTDVPTDSPTDAPTDPPTDAPTDSPTDAPTDSPTDEPTVPPTDAPTDPPTDEPTDSPTDVPTDSPTDEPTVPPTDAPTDSPTDVSTDSPTDAPTDSPTDAPTASPTDAPTDSPTDAPTDSPTDEPTDPPTDEPTDSPTDAPTDSPTDEPTTEVPTTGRPGGSANITVLNLTILFLTLCINYISY